jgi:hypothetical protein
VISLSPEMLARQKNRQGFVQAVKHRAERKEAELSGDAGIKEELRELCILLHELAQRYVPNTPQTFVDFNSLTCITKSLKRLCAAAPLASNIVAPTNSIERGAIVNSAEYRKLRNKFIAALATIADLPTKSAPAGELQFQSGVREGYRRASEIAVLFLNDIQNGVLQ